MDRLPVEVIGNILSAVGVARDIVSASATCRKWREAFRKHLHTLSFSSDDWSYDRYGPSQAEILITKTIFQTRGLQDLTIFMKHYTCFSASIVHAWLIYTRETLHVLRYNVRSYGGESVNILEICGRDKLEVIELTDISIAQLKPDFQRFPCLKSLMLRKVSVSALDLNTLLSACPVVELFVLSNPTINMSDVDKKVELSSTTLRSIFLESVRVDKIILEADCLEILHVKDCNLKDFEVIGTGTLKQLKLDNVRVSHLCIGENIENLEVVDISDFSILWPSILEMISKSSSLRKLRLWNKDVTVEDEVEAETEAGDESHDEEDEEDDEGEGDEDEDEIVDEGEDVNMEDVDHSLTPQLTLPCVDLETVAVCFPKLSHLSLSFDLRDEGSSYLTNVRVLELGGSVITDAFTEWVEGLVKRCPNLKRLVIHGDISATKGEDKCRALANFNSSMVQFVRSYMQVEVQFEFR